MFVTNWISTTKIQKISEITNFFRHYFLSRTEVIFPHGFLTFHTIHFWHKTHKHLIINTKSFFLSFWHADCDYDDRVR